MFKNLPCRYLDQVLMGGILALAVLLFWRADVGVAWCILLLVLLAVGSIAGLVRSGGGLASAHSLIRLWLAFLVLIGLTALMGDTRELALGAFLQGFLLPAALPLLLVSVISDGRRLNGVFLALLAGLLIGMGKNLTQYVQEWQVLGALSNDIQLHRVYANALVFGLPFLLGAYCCLERSKAKTLVFLLLVMALSMIVLTGARGAWLAAVFTVATFVVFCRDRGLMAASLVVVVVVVVGMFTVIPPEFGMAKVQQGLDTSNRGSGTWGPAVQMIRERPWLGYGYGMDVFHHHFNARVANFPEWSSQASLGPHNFFMAVAFAGGVMSLLLLLTIFGLTVARLGQLLGRLRQEAVARHDPRYVGGVGLLSLFGAAIVLQGLVEDRSWPPIGFWFGLSLAWIVITQRQLASTSSCTSQSC